MHKLLPKDKTKEKFMKKKIIFKGAATALVTPFDALGRIDFTAFGDLIERQISECIDALVICGTT